MPLRRRGDEERSTDWFGCCGIFRSHDLAPLNVAVDLPVQSNPGLSFPNGEEGKDGHESEGQAQSMVYCLGRAAFETSSARAACIAPMHTRLEEALLASVFSFGSSWFDRINSDGSSPRGFKISMFALCKRYTHRSPTWCVCATVRTGLITQRG